jgi:hypothetical protein
MQPDTSSSNLAQNTNGSPYEMYTATFGNVNFQIQPSQTGEVSNTFGTVAYVSLESVIYAQQMQAQVSPTNIVSGQNTGTQNIQGSTTIQDSNGLNRMVMGFSPSGF